MGTVFSTSFLDVKCGDMKRYLLRRNKENKGWFFIPISQVSWFSIVAAVLMFDFFIIKAIVQGFEYYPSDYIAIKNALQKDPPDGKIDKNYQNALVKEIIAATDTGINTNSANTEKNKLISLGDLKKLLQIKTNNYQLMSSGGIKALEITVLNPSTHFIEAVTVQVDYLEEGGKLVQTEAFTTNYIKPKSSKIIHIPSNTKGSKIIYRITNVKSSECVSRQFEA
jgi:hypothetical protein